MNTLTHSSTEPIICVYASAYRLSVTPERVDMRARTRTNKDADMRTNRQTKTTCIQTNIHTETQTRIHVHTCTRVQICQNNTIGTQTKRLKKSISTASASLKQWSTSFNTEGWKATKRLLIKTTIRRWTGREPCLPWYLSRLRKIRVFICIRPPM